MSLLEDIRFLSNEVGLSRNEKRELDEFVDNYIGKPEEEYISNKEYYESHKNLLKPVINKIKDKQRFTPFIEMLRPHINKGILDLL